LAFESRPLAAAQAAFTLASNFLKSKGFEVSIGA